jgi:tetratricopeptide (TPR) repeat protein
MAKESKNPLTDLLKQLGFKAEPRQNWQIWALGHEAMQISKPKNASKGGPPRTQSPWSFKTLKFEERKDSLRLHHIDMTLDPEQLRQNLSILTRKYFGTKTQAEFVSTHAHGVWCLFEFSRPGSRDKLRGYSESSGGALSPQGIGGFRFNFRLEGTSIRIVFSDFFGIGYVPPNLATKPQQFVREALCLVPNHKALKETQEEPNLFEIGFNICSPALHHLAKKLDITITQIASLMVELGKNDFQVNSRVESEESLLHFQAPSETRPGQSFLDGLEFLPAEVLEARELSSNYREMEVDILNGKIARAKSKLDNLVREQSNDRFLVRRLALLAVIGQVNLDRHLFESALEHEGDNTLLLSGSIATAQNLGDQKGVLGRVSELGLYLMTKVENAETVRTFDVVLPELLGDAWRSENRIRAEECYQRIIQKRGDLPRILRKLIHLAKASGQTEIEFGFLERLSKVERRRVELAKIFNRMALIRTAHPSQREESIKLAIQSLEHDRNLYSSGFIAAERLCECHKAEEAIRLLDGILKSQKTHLSAKSKSEIETRIAKIWSEQLERQDLAEKRLESALELDIENVEAADRLETIFRDQGNVESTVRMLELKFDALEKHEDSNGIRQVFEELVDLYRGVLGQPNKAFTLYERLLANSFIEPEEVERVLSWREVSIDWRNLYDKLNAKAKKIDDEVRRAKFHNRLGDICRQKLGDDDAAKLHLLDALHSGYIESEGFSFLVEKISAEGETHLLVRCYETRLDMVTDPSERLKLIGEILAIPGVLPEDQRDLLALESYLLEPDVPGLLEQRMSFYQSMDDLHNMSRLIETIAAQDIPSFSAAKWMERGIEALSNFSSNERYEAMDSVFKELLQIHEDRDSVLENAVHKLKKNKDKSLLLYYVIELLELDKLPDLTESQVQALLKGRNEDLAKFHQLKCFGESKLEVAAQHARTAISLYGTVDGSDKILESLLGRLGTLVPCAEDEIQYLSSIVERTSNWPVLARVLKKQAKFEDETNRKTNLLRSLAKIYAEKLHDYTRSMATYEETLELAGNQFEILWNLAKLARKLGDAERESERLYQVIHHPDAVDKPRHLNDSVNRLLKMGVSKSSIHKEIQEIAENAINAGNRKYAAALSRSLIANDIESTTLFQQIFTHHMFEGEYGDAVDVWWRGLACVSSGSHVRQFLRESRTIMAKFEGDILLDCIQRAIDKRVSNRLGPKISREILIFYGEQLFEKDSRRHESLRIYREAMETDRSDSRSWMPLYFLLSEFGTPRERYEHLQFIVPQIHDDSRPLKNFPLTIESLEAELLELEREFSSSDSAEEENNEKNESEIKQNQIGNEHQNELDPMLQKEAERAGVNQLPGDYTDIVSLDDLNQSPDFNGSHADPVLPSPASPMSPLTMEPASDLAPPSLPIANPFPQDNPQPAVASLDLGSVEEAPEGKGFSLNLDASEDGSAALNLDFEPQPALQPVLMDVEAAPEALPEEANFNMDLPVESAGENMPSESDQDQSLELEMEPIVEQIQPGSESANFDDASQSVSSVSLAAAVFETKVDDESLIGLPVADVDAPTEEEASIGETEEQSEDEEQDIPDPEPSSLSIRIDVPEDTSSLPAPPTDTDSDSTNSDSLPPLPPDQQSQSFDTEGDDEPTQALAVGDFGAGSLNEGNLIDWRAAVTHCDFNADLTQKLMSQAFASEIEKHVAIQSVALIAGNCSQLNNWHWRVWRKASEYGYSLSGGERYPSGHSPEILQSSLYRFVLTLAPLFVKLYKKRFTLEEQAAKLKISIEQLHKLKQPMPWNAGILKDVGFGLYSERIAKHRYSAYNLPGLNQKVLYEGSTRSIIFDATYYQSQPPSHLFHRILGLLWSVRLRYFVALELDPINEILPALAEIHQIYGTTGITKIKSILGSNSQMKKILVKLDSNKIRSLYQKVGLPTEDKVLALHSAMRDHLYRLALAETLDLVGIFETITNRDLTKPSATKHSEIFELAPGLANLIKFITKLNL